MSNRENKDCPHCGAEIDARATACPECGSDETTGWSSDAEGDLDDEFDYKDSLKREFGHGGGRNRFHPWIIATALIVILLFLLTYL